MDIVEALMSTVVAISNETLGFKQEDIGMHSTRLGVAMTMYLGEYPDYTIMMIRR